jgi:hypothetical protein
MAEPVSRPRHFSCVAKGSAPATVRRIANYGQLRRPSTSALGRSRGAGPKFRHAARPSGALSTNCRLEGYGAFAWPGHPARLARSSTKPLTIVPLSQSPAHIAKPVASVQRDVYHDDFGSDLRRVVAAAPPPVASTRSTSTPRKRHQLWISDGWSWDQSYRTRIFSIRRHLLATCIQTEIHPLVAHFSRSSDVDGHVVRPGIRQFSTTESWG